MGDHNDRGYVETAGFLRKKGCASIPTPASDIGRGSRVVIAVSFPCYPHRASLMKARPRYALFELPAEDIEICLELTGRAIVISGWLAAIARRELTRFREFISWLRYGNSFRCYPS
jgi:Anaphase-promoting complex, cyclosome, subunit 4